MKPLTFADLDAMRAQAKPVIDDDLIERTLHFTYDTYFGDVRLIDWMKAHLYGEPYRTPVDAVMMQQATALGMATEGIYKEELKEDRARIAGLLQMATPYLWSTRCMKLAMAANMPRHIISRSVLPLPVMWWVFEEPILAVYEDTREALIQAALILDGREGTSDEDAESCIRVFFMGHDDKEEAIVVSGTMKYGAVYPDALMSGGMNETLLQMLSFLNSPYVSHNPRPMTRSERRHAERTGHSAPENDVHVIMLRHAVNRSARHREGDGDGRVMDYQELVSGYHRAQFYPSENAHRVIWIAPYIRGPENAPFREKVRAVVR